MWQVEAAWFCLFWTIIVITPTPHWPWWPTSRWWRWWWCSTRRWSQLARWRWRGRPGSCRPATATPPWSLSSTGCRNLTIRGSEGPVTVSQTNLPLVSWRSKKNRIGTENTILVNQADNTSHFALLSETKEKFYHCKFGEVAMTGEWLCLVSTHSSCWISSDEWWRRICPHWEPPARKWTRKWPPADKTWQKNWPSKKKLEHSGSFL